MEEPPAALAGHNKQADPSDHFSLSILGLHTQYSIVCALVSLFTMHVSPEQSSDAVSHQPGSSQITDE